MKAGETKGEIKIDIDTDDSKRLSFMSTAKLRSTTTFRRVAPDIMKSSEEQRELDYLALIQNETRKEKLKQVKSSVLELLSAYEHEISNPDDDEQRKSRTDLLQSLCVDIDGWIIQRYLTLKAELNPVKNIQKSPLHDAMENLHWVFLFKDNNEGVPKDEINQEIWERYALKVENKNIQFEELGDQAELEVESILPEATEYFSNAFKMELNKANSIAFADGLFKMPLYDNATKFWPFFEESLNDKFSKPKLAEEIFPRLILLVCISKSRQSSDLLYLIIEKRSDLITKDSANAALEFSCHIAQSNCSLVLLDKCHSMITIDGIVTGFLVATLRGNERLIFILQEQINEGLSSNEWPVESFFTLQQGSTFGSFSDTTPFVYVLLGLAAESSNAQTSCIPPLVNFRNMPNVLENNTKGGVTENMHSLFMNATFDLACRLNHSNVAYSMIVNDWSPDDISLNILESVQLGHQVVVSTLLTSLLTPDPLINFESGAVPLLFRKSKALRVLPMVARRFPDLTAWFLEEMSCIPVPSCVPPTEDHDPATRSKLVRGIRLGSANLSDIMDLTEDGVSMKNIWQCLTFDGQLRKASAKASDKGFEGDCVICMAPAILLTEPAVRENSATDNYETNSIIRLIGTSQADIILSPLVEALMEYHWAFGHFWIRFAFQFLTMLIFIISNALMYFQVVARGEGVIGYRDPTTLFYGVIALCMSVVFLVQELRQYLDDKSDYVSSGTNMLDLVIHFTSAFLVIGNAFLGLSVPPLVNALVVLLSSYRVILYLRIFPSVGPMVRITTSALPNVTPIFVPILILLFAYSAAWYIIHTGIYGQGNTNYTSYWISLQYSFTMLTFDYTMLTHTDVFQIFFTRMIFHFTFLICFVNLIVALMTVNVADVTSNLRSSWLFEVSNLMVELEIYWPFPYKYKRPSGSDLTVLDSRIRTRKVRNVFKEAQNIGIVLYTCPKERVALKSWWTDFPKASHPDTVEENLQTMHHESSLIKRLFKTEEEGQNRVSVIGRRDSSFTKKAAAFFPAAGRRASGANLLSKLRTAADSKQERTSVVDGVRFSMLKRGEFGKMASFDEREDEGEFGKMKSFHANPSVSSNRYDSQQLLKYDGIGSQSNLLGTTLKKNLGSQKFFGSQPFLVEESPERDINQLVTAIKELNRQVKELRKSQESMLEQLTPKVL